MLLKAKPDLASQSSLHTVASHVYFELTAVRGALWLIGLASREALGNKAVKRSLHADLFQMDVLGAD